MQLVERITAGGELHELEATPAERAALAARFDLIEVGSLHARVRVMRLEDGVIEVAGRLSAAVEQRCVVTLEPIGSSLRADFRRLFTREPGADQSMVEIDPDADLIEPLDGELLDLGEIVAEELALALDPFPRAAGAALESAHAGSDLNPFAALASWPRH